MKVLNYGSLNVDYVYSVDHIIVGGETQHSSKLEVFSGGKGLNQSIALAKAGVPVYHAGIVGSDGDILLDACKEAGVNTKYIRRLPVKGGHKHTPVRAHGVRNPGCRATFCGAAIVRMRSSYQIIKLFIKFYSVAIL